MTPGFFHAHILAMHLAVPEVVTFKIKDLWPVDRCAQVIRHGPDGFPKEWEIQFDLSCWNKYPKLRARVIAHEVCHAAYDYQAPAWDSLTYAEQGQRHSRINACVHQILRDCVVARLGTVIETPAKSERALRIRAERAELLERGAR